MRERGSWQQKEGVQQIAAVANADLLKKRQQQQSMKYSDQQHQYSRRRS